MIAIYSNNYSTDHYIQKLKFQQQYQVYHSIDQYVEVAADVKIAFINHINSYEPPESEQQRLDEIIDGKKFSQEIALLKNVSDLLFAFDNEIHAYHLNIFQQHTQSNVFWALPGQIEQHKNCIVWNNHFDITVGPYRQLNTKLSQINYNFPKPMYFDALLGNQKPHRNFIFESITAKQLTQKILLTYMTQHTDRFKEKFLWEPDIEKFNDTVTRPTDQVMYCGQSMALARILPIQVYNQTAYSIVAETGAANWNCFFTEKTAKPIMARRLFVVFSGRGFLHNLRKIGFRTFDTVIDEGYDLVYNDHERWSAAFEQVQRLCEIDQQQVFEKIAPTVEHNYQLLMNTDWKQHMLDQLQQKINHI